MSSFPKPKEEVYRVEIILQENIYNPGDTITGTVYFDNKRKLTCDHIEAKLVGQIRVFWTEEKVTTTALRQTSAYEQKKILIDQTSVIWQEERQKKPKRTNEVTLEDITRMASSTSIRPVRVGNVDQPGIEQGRHQFSFSFDLPKEGLFTTFDSQSSSGCVQYWVQMNAVFEGRVILQRKIFFAVVVQDNLNENPLATQPINVDNIFTLGDLGSVEVNVKMPKSGLCPGESIDAVVTINNRTKKSIKYATLNIAQRHFCYATEPMFASKETKYETPGFPMPVDKIKSGDTVSFTSLGHFHLPSLTPAITIPEFLLVDYKLQLTLGLKRASRSSAFGTVQIPIFIGTSPVTVHPPQYNESSVLRRRKENEANQPVQPSAPLLVHYDEPPKYEQIDTNPPPLFDYSSINASQSAKNQ